MNQKEKLIEKLNEIKNKSIQDGNQDIERLSSEALEIASQPDPPGT